MTENTDRDGEPGNGGAQGAQRSEGGDLVDDALRLVDDLQRKLLRAGVKRGVTAAASPAAKKDDVWGEAIRLETEQKPRPPMEEVWEIVRTSGPEVAGHLGRAGLSLAAAVGRTWGVVEKSIEQGREEAKASSESGQDGTGRRDEGGSGQITAGGSR